MKRYLLIMAAVLLLPAVMFAQGTTSGSIEGTVVDVDGQPLPGANVVAVHQPTGTRYGTATRTNGRYLFNNVRVGGPYEIQVTFVGYNANVKEISEVQLGETVTVDFTLEEGEMSLEEISVVAQADETFNRDRTGAGTNIGSEEINQTPTLSRSLGDFTRLTPQATGGGSFSGDNDRYNNLMVDGATLNDVFGLGEGTPGSQAGVESPISVDAIQEFNVDLAPFEVTNNNFTGGQINAVTKSGTNNFTGSAYYQLRNENFVGNYITEEGQVSEDVEAFDEQFLGLTMGGPIVEDKLFYFVNAEFKRETTPLTGGLINSGQDNSFDMYPSTFDEIQSIAQNQYGYNPGNFGNTLDMAQDNNKILAKIDWNVNDDHKVTFRYNHVDATDEEGLGRGTSSYSFSNRQYNFNSAQNSFVAELNSSFGNNASNTLRAVYTRIRDSRDVVAEPFPEVNVSLPFPERDNDYGSIFMGIDRFSQANALDQDLIEITDNFTYIAGDHEFTIGTSNQIFSFRNLFVQDDFGTYEFRSIEDFEAGNPYSYNYSYLREGGNRSAEFDAIQLGGYIQDKWTIQNNLRLTFGLRMDVPIMPDEPTANPDVADAFPGYSTDRIASGNVLWSPRFGFNWAPDTGEYTTQIRGGAGIFSGTPPFVWISNQYSNTGADYGRVAVNDFSINGTGDDLGDGFFSPDPNDQPTPGDGSGLPTVETTEVNLIEEDFKYPQAAKFNLAVDQNLPYDITATLEGMYSKSINAVVYRNANLEQTGTSAYGRPIYGFLEYNDRFRNADGTKNRVDERFTDALVLDNANKGYNYSVTAELTKRFDWGLRTNVSYTLNRAENVNNGTSSRAISNWQYNENFDVNNPRIGTADFERRHRFLANVGYTFSWAERFRTTVSVIYDGRSGTPFSWIYSGDANGDERFDNDLMYVPSSEDEVVVTSGNWNELNEWIGSEASLDEYRGEVVPRNTAREPWTNFLDFRINQEIETFSGQRLEITASMFNVLNFLNEEWGLRESVSFNNYQAVNIEGYVDEEFMNGRGSQYNLSSDDIGKPIVNFNPQNVTEDEIFSTSNLGSRWQMQIGLRYSF